MILICNLVQKSNEPLSNRVLVLLLLLGRQIRLQDGAHGALQRQKLLIECFLDFLRNFRVS